MKIYQSIFVQLVISIPIVYEECPRKTAQSGVTLPSWMRAWTVLKHLMRSRKILYPVKNMTDVRRFVYFSCSCLKTDNVSVTPQTVASFSKLPPDGFVHWLAVPWYRIVYGWCVADFLKTQCASASGYFRLNKFVKSVSLSFMGRARLRSFFSHDGFHFFQMMFNNLSFWVNSRKDITRSQVRGTRGPV